MSYSDVEAMDQLEQLIEFFRSEAGHAFGVEGDHMGWTPAQTAVHFLTILSADSDVRFLKTNFDEFSVQMNRQMDKLQRRFNELEAPNESA